MIHPDPAAAIAAGVCSWDLNAWSRSGRDGRDQEVDHSYYHACGTDAAVRVFRRINGDDSETMMGLLCADHERRSRRAVGAMQGVDLDRYRWEAIA